MKKIFEKCQNQLLGSCKNLRAILSFDADDTYLHSYKRWMKLVEKENPFPAFKVDNPADHLATIIYTSGTTGNPKGVELTHSNIISNIASLEVLWEKELSHDHRSVCFLPWAHVFGQVCELHSLMAGGGTMAIAPNREALLECIGIVKPTMMASVPMLFNKVYDGVMQKMSQETQLKRMVFKFALNIARERNRRLEFGESVGYLMEFEYKLMDKIVLSKIRERLGGNLKFFASGGAATSLPVIQFFEDIGVPVCEGYGLTETSPVISSSSWGWKNRRLGTVGVPLDGQTVKIVDPETLEEVKSPSDEGEICVAGPNVMKGYRNNPEANAEVFFYGKADGLKYFRTGDLGRFVDGRFLKITGRIKEQYKLENGKYVVPGPIEDMICRSHYIQQVLLFGDNKPYNVLLVVPDFVTLRQWVTQHMSAVSFSGISPENDRKMTELKEVQDLISMELISACGPMKNYERPQKWAILPEAFTQENFMLTPKMSVRRKNVLVAYKDKIDGMYDGSSGISLQVHHSIPK